MSDVFFITIKGPQGQQMEELKRKIEALVPRWNNKVEPIVVLNEVDTAARKLETVETSGTVKRELKIELDPADSDPMGTVQDIKAEVARQLGEILPTYLGDITTALDGKGQSDVLTTSPEVLRLYEEALTQLAETPEAEVDPKTLDVVRESLLKVTPVPNAQSEKSISQRSALIIDRLLTEVVPDDTQRSFESVVDRNTNEIPAPEAIAEPAIKNDNYLSLQDYPGWDKNFADKVNLLLDFDVESIEQPIGETPTKLIVKFRDSHSNAIVETLQRLTMVNSIELVHYSVDDNNEIVKFQTLDQVVIEYSVSNPLTLILYVSGRRDHSSHIACITANTRRLSGLSN